MTRARIGAVAAGVAVLLLAACGSSGNGESGKSADQVAKDASAALKAAKSFHVRATVDDAGGGSQGFSGPLTLDLDLVPPSTMSGTLSAEGVTAHLVFVNNKFYLQGRSLWEKFAGAQAATVIGDRWVLIPESAVGSFSGLNSFTDIANCLVPATGNKSNGTTVVNGQSVVEVTNATASATLDVAADGTPYPLRLVQKSGGSSSSSSSNSTSSCAGSGGGTATFSNFDKGATVTPPPDALDLSKLGG